MKTLLLSCLFGAFALPSAAANLALRPPAFSEAVYGTPEDPLVWTGGPFIGISSLSYRSRLHDARIVAFDIANATPGGIVSWYFQYLGVVGADGAFSITSPIIPLTDGYDRQFAGRIHVRLPYGAYNEFDLVRIQVTGSKPSVTPEPSSWALMILGFGSIGAAARRRRSMVA